MFWKRSTRASKEDENIFLELDPLLDELWVYMRYLSDLKAVWPNLTEEQQKDIDNSPVQQNRFHEKRAEELVEAIELRTLELKAHRHTALKGKILEFLDDWKDQEPDMLKVIHAMMIRDSRKA